MSVYFCIFSFSSWNNVLKLVFFAPLKVHKLISRFSYTSNSYWTFYTHFTERPASLLWSQAGMTAQPLWQQSAIESTVPLTTYDTSISVVTIISQSPASMATVIEWALCTTYHKWRQHLCCDYNKWSLAIMRQSASEPSVRLTTNDTSIYVVTTISDPQAVMTTVSEWVLCTTYHIWRQHLCCDYN